MIKESESQGCYKVTIQLPVSFLYLFLFFWGFRVTPYLLSLQGNIDSYSIAFSCLYRLIHMELAHSTILTETGWTIVATSSLGT